jgi:peptide/nickel transport system substrate-binding protein
LAAYVVLLVAGWDGTPALAQKYGGVLKIEHMDSPPSPSIHEEATVSVVMPFMALFNNLVLYKQDVAQTSLDSIVPELATEWAWNADKTELAFKLREGVRWHDGKPFTAADVKCTFEMVADLSATKLRKNPRQAWYANLQAISTEGDYAVIFHLKRTQPSLIALLASGWAPIYPCHIPPDRMRTAPIGTGPFKFVSFQQNETIRLNKNPDYWKKDRPYLDGIEYKIIASRATRMLAFTSGAFDMTFPTDVSVPLLKDIKSQAPQALCTMRPTNVSTNLIINRDAPPFDNPDIRRALALTIDRKAFIDIISEGQDKMGGSLLPPPEGVWGMPPDMLKTIVGYDPDIKKSRETARALMRKAGYGPDKRLKTTVSTRDIPTFRDPAVILVDQLKEIYIDGTLNVIDTTVYYTKVFRKEYTVGLNLTGNSVDDPDQNFYEGYACGSLRNYTNYCNPELEKLFEQQSVETDLAKRHQLVWEIDRRLQEDIARPIIYHGLAAGCWQPYVKGLVIMVNSIYNGWRFEDLWLDKS